MIFPRTAAGPPDAKSNRGRACWSRAYGPGITHASVICLRCASSSSVPLNSGWSGGSSAISPSEPEAGRKSFGDSQPRSNRCNNGLSSRSEGPQTSFSTLRRRRAPCWRSRGELAGLPSVKIFPPASPSPPNRAATPRSRHRSRCRPPKSSTRAVFRLAAGCAAARRRGCRRR